MKNLFKNKKIIVAAASLVAVMAVTIGASLAIYSDNTDPMENTFAVGSVETELKEVIDGMKKQPYVENVGTSDCYVRIRVNVSPSDVGISLEGLSGTDWVDGGDGFYYYTKALKPQEVTSDLFKKVVLPNEWYTDGNPEKPILADKFVPFDISLYHEAVQTSINTEDGKVTDMMTIWRKYEAGEIVVTQNTEE